MRAALVVCLTAALLGAGCRDGNSLEPASPLGVTTDSATYTATYIQAAGAWMSSVEVGLRNNSSSTIWIGSCGTAYSSRPGKSPVIAVYGLQVISYATTPPTVSDVAQVCNAAPVPYALAPGMGVRMSVTFARTGRFAVSAPYSDNASGAYEQRAGSADFTIGGGP